MTGEQTFSGSTFREYQNEWCQEDDFNAKAQNVQKELEASEVERSNAVFGASEPLEAQ